MRRAFTLLVLMGVFMTLTLAPAGAAATVSTPLVDGLAGPLGLAVTSDGTIYVTQAFAGLVTAVGPNGGAKVIASSSDPNASFSGVAATSKNNVTLTLSGENNGDYIGLVQRLQSNGSLRTIGDPGTYEETRNPDRKNTYGFIGLTPECAASIPEDVGGFPYRGVVDSNAYALAFMPDGAFMVADAGGNDIVRVAPDGRVRTVAVLPPIGYVLTADVAAGFGIPECAVGSTYNFEPVPTDVELGPDGMLYVSSLPGGPEDGTFGGLGSVFKVNPKNGAVTQVATGFTTATDLAVAPDGTIYVTELFGNRISKVVNGGAELVAEVNQPVAIEWANGKLYASIDAFGNGAVVTITP